MENCEPSKLGAMSKETRVPEWEHTAASGGVKEQETAVSSNPSFKAALTTKLDRVLPPRKKYLGQSRRVLLWVVLAIVLALLALIIGLSAGLTHKSKDQDLPLPSTGGIFTGDLTYYEPGLGACGITSTSAEDIVSISHFLFDAAGSSSSTGGNSNANPLCGQKLRASRFDENVGAQRSVDLTVVDRCTGCQPDDLDTSLSVFEKLAVMAQGRVDVTWAWLEPVATGV